MAITRAMLNGHQPTIITPWSYNRTHGLLVACDKTLFVFMLNGQPTNISTIDLDNTCVQLRHFNGHVSVLLDNGILSSYQLSISTSPCSCKLSFQIANIHLLSNDGCYALTTNGDIVSSLSQRSLVSVPVSQYNAKSVVQFSLVNVTPVGLEFVMCTDNKVLYYTSIRIDGDNTTRRLVLDWTEPLSGILTLGKDMSNRLVTLDGRVVECSREGRLCEVARLGSSVVGCTVMLHDYGFSDLTVNDDGWLRFNTRKDCSGWAKISCVGKENVKAMSSVKRD